MYTAACNNASAFSVAVVAARKVVHEGAQYPVVMPLRMGLPASNVDVPQPRLARTHHPGKTTIGLGSGLDHRRVHILHEHRDGLLHRHIGLDLMFFQIVETLSERSLGVEIAPVLGAKHD